MNPTDTGRKMVPLPCPFCGSSIKRIVSMAKSFDPPREYIEYHHELKNDCYLLGNGSSTLASTADDYERERKFLSAWNRRAAAPTDTVPARPQYVYGPLEMTKSGARPSSVTLTNPPTPADGLAGEIEALLDKNIEWWESKDSGCGGEMRELGVLNEADATQVSIGDLRRLLALARSHQAPVGEDAELRALRKFFKAWKEIKDCGGRFTMDMAEAELEIEAAVPPSPQTGGEPTKEKS